eukprot:scaffold3877_cov106-Alexandrium_tamarense.AAC.2
MYYIDINTFAGRLVGVVWWPVRAMRLLIIAALLPVNGDHGDADLENQQCPSSAPTMHHRYSPISVDDMLVENSILSLSRAPRPVVAVIGVVGLREQTLIEL